MNAIKELIPNAEHKNCAKHIYAKKKGFKGEKFKSLFWDFVQMRSNGKTGLKQSERS